MGWTLNRYFLSRYATITTWFFLGILALIFLVTFTELASRMEGITGFTLSTTLGISALRTPLIMLQTVPFVALFAAMATLVSLNRKYELVIARSAGISAWQFLLPVCAGAFIFGLLSISILNPLAAYGFSRAEELETQVRTGQSVFTPAAQPPWLRQRSADGDTIIGAREVAGRGLELIDPVFFELDQNGELIERKDAERAVLHRGYWELSKVQRFRGGERLPSVETMRVATNLTPEFVQERLARPETIPVFQLPGKIEAAHSYGLNANPFAMQLHSLLALPLLMVAMTLIAATVSMRFARMGQSATMILGGIVAGFLLYVVSVLVRAFGNAGLMPPAVAAWFPVVLAMFFGVTFLLYKEDG